MGLLLLFLCLHEVVFGLVGLRRFSLCLFVFFFLFFCLLFLLLSDLLLVTIALLLSLSDEPILSSDVRIWRIQVLFELVFAFIRRRYYLLFGLFLFGFFLFKVFKPVLVLGDDFVLQLLLQDVQTFGVLEGFFCLAVNLVDFLVDDFDSLQDGGG